jgi:hypothetical protein
VLREVQIGQVDANSARVLWQPDAPQQELLHLRHGDDQAADCSGGGVLDQDAERGCAVLKRHRLAKIDA